MNSFNNLSLREKVILIVAAVALLFLSIHAFIWQPLVDGAISYQEQLEQEQDNLRWIQENIGQLKNTTVKVKKIQGSLVSWLDLQIKKNTLNNQLKRIKPRGDHQVKIWLEEAEGKKVMQFLSSINQYNIKIEEIKLVSIDNTGFINATIILESIQ